MTAVIRLRPEMFEPERLKDAVETARSEAEPAVPGRWPLFATILFAVGVSVALWVALVWAVIAVF